MNFLQFSLYFLLGAFMQHIVIQYTCVCESCWLCDENGPHYNSKDKPAIQTHFHDQNHAVTDNSFIHL